MGGTAGAGGCLDCGGDGGAGGGGGEPMTGCEQSLLAFDEECQSPADRQCCEHMQLCEQTDGCHVALICKVGPVIGRCPDSPEADDLLDCLNRIPACLPDAGVCTSLVTIDERCDQCLSPSQARGGCCEAFDDAADADIDAFLSCLNGTAACDALGAAAVNCALIACGDVCPPLG